MTVAAEQWRPVPAYEGRYEISDHGRVRSVARAVGASHGSTRVVPGRIMAQRPDPRGYLCVKLSSDGTERTKRVHRLVAAAFLGPRPENCETRHGPGGQRDNRATNLAYGTRSDNARDRRRDGTDASLAKTHCPQGHALEAPNLSRSALEVSGHRHCLSCTRGWATASYAASIGRVLDPRVESDRHYAALMRTA